MEMKIGSTKFDAKMTNSLLHIVGCLVELCHKLIKKVLIS